MSLPIIRSFQITPDMPSLQLPILEQAKVRMLQEYSQTKDRNTLSEENLEYHLREIVQVLIEEAKISYLVEKPELASVGCQTLPQTIIRKLEDKILRLKEDLDIANHDN